MQIPETSSGSSPGQKETPLRPDGPGETSGANVLQNSQPVRLKRGASLKMATAVMRENGGERGGVGRG